MKCIKLNFCLFIRTLDKGMVGAFYCNKGFFLCTSGADYRQNTLFFPQFDYKYSQLENKFKKLSIQPNFNGSNTFGTMKICSRQG